MIWCTGSTSAAIPEKGKKRSSPAARWSTSRTRAAWARAGIRRWWRSTPRLPRRPGAVAGLQHRPRAYVDEVLRQPALDGWLDREFRDPKVFRYEPEQKWVMVLVEGGASARSASPRLTRTSRPGTHLSDFGPGERYRRHLGAPDLFPLAGRWQAAQQEMGHGRQPQPRLDRWRLGHPVSSATSTARRFTADNVQPYTPPAARSSRTRGLGLWRLDHARHGVRQRACDRHAAWPADGVGDSWATVWLTASLDFDSSQGTLTSRPSRISRTTSTCSWAVAPTNTARGCRVTPPPGELFGGFESNLRGRGL